jgi:HK97 family phage prohead protease
MKEIRSSTVTKPFAVRTLPDGSKQVSGYAIVWNSPSVDIGGFVEVCDPGMLTRTLRESPDVLMLRDHKSELLLGRTTASTLSLSVDGTGLAFTVTLPKSGIGDDTAENVRLRNLTGCSFGFSTVEDTWNVTSDGKALRTLLDVDLFEISITSFPAYQETSVTTRSRAAQMTTRDADDDDGFDDPCDPTTDPECDPDNTSEDVDEEDSVRCSCRCERCNMRDCANCYTVRCSDRSCLDGGCPMQDDTRSDKPRLRQLFDARQRLISTTL